MPGYGSGPYGFGPYGGTPPITGTSSNQGFVFQLSSDAPCNLPLVMQQLAAQVDAKGAQLDIDVARLRANNFVKISKANQPGGLAVTFDTIEVNRGTPTDLSIYNGLLLNPGVWMVGAGMTVADTAPRDGDMKTMSVSNLSIFTNFGIIETSTNQLYEKAGGLSGPLIWPHQRASVVMTTIVAAPSTQISCGAGGGSVTDPLSYVDFWAFQVGDL
jgi:hypothetical protein